MATRKRQRGELALAVILGLAVASGFVIGKKNEDRKLAGLPHGQTTATWQTAPPVQSGSAAAPKPTQ
ncbi:MAG TPA: hypothetical protein VF406_04610 [Thermodesulfobacteriota bacterium]